jgi:hypothetical protein
MSSERARLRRGVRAPGRLESKSQLPTELLLTFFAIFSGMILVRVLLLSAGMTESLWVGQFIFGITNIFAFPLRLFPGGDFEVLNRLTVADLTLFAAVIAFPCFMVARSRSRPR